MQQWFLACESWIRVYKYNRLPCVDRTQKQKQTFLEFVHCCPICSVMKRACACGQVNHSAFCHFIPFAFLHLICDGAVDLFFIPLQWKHYHRNQNVGRRPVSYCPFTSPLVLGNSTEAPETNCAVDGRCSGGKPHGPSTFPTVCVVSILEEFKKACKQLPTEPIISLWILGQHPQLGVWWKTSLLQRLLQLSVPLLERV